MKGYISKSLLLLFAIIGHYSALKAQCPSNKPTLPSTQFAATADPSGSVITLNWTRGNGQGRIIIAKQGAPVDALPVDCLATSEIPTQGFPFATGKNLGNGNYVVAHLTNSSTDQVLIIHLTPGATYHFAIAELNYVNGKFDFLLTNISRVSQTTTSCTSFEPSVASTNMTITSVSSNRLSINWNSGNGQQRIGILTTSNNTIFTPLDNTPLYFPSSFTTPNTIDFSQAYTLTLGNKLVYVGSGNSFYLENLPSGVSFTLNIYEVNTCQYNFLTSSKLMRTFSSCPNKPTIQPSSLTVTNVTTTSLQLNWVNGNGQMRMVVVRKNGSAIYTPIDCSNSISIFEQSLKIIEVNTNTINIPALEPGEAYDLTVFEGNFTQYDYLTMLNNYQTTGAPTITASTQSCIKNEPTIQSTNLTFTNITSNSVTLNWSNGNGTKRVVLANANAIPSDISDYFPYELVSNYISSNFNQTIKNLDGTSILYQGTGNSLNVSGLYTENFYFKVIEFNTTCGNDHFFIGSLISSVCIPFSPPNSLITPSGTISSCYQSVPLNCNTFLPSTAQFQWYKRLPNQTDILISGATSRNYIVTESGDYVLKITVSCSTTTSTPVSVVLNTSPSAIFNENTTFCGNNGEIMINSTTGNPDLFRIDWSNGSNIAGAQDLPYTQFTNNKVQISNLPNTYQTYGGILYFKNSSTTCEIGYPLTVTTKLNQTINFYSVPNKIYGAAPFPITASSTSGLSVILSISNSLIANINGNTITIQNSGSTTIIASQSGNGAYCAANHVTQLLTINKAVLTATPIATSRTYGAANPTFAINYTGFVNGENASVIDSPPLRSTTATVTSNTGTYPITVSGGTDNNYTFTYGAPATLTITKAALTATSTATKVYGAANPAFPITYTGLMNGETATVIDTPPTTSSTATTTSNVGSYPITLSGGSDNNYTITNQTGSLSVTKKNLTATAVSTSKYVGQPNPPFSISYSGFVNGENSSVLDVQPVTSTTATTGSPIGSYPINISGGSDNNYAYTYVNGVLSVLAAPTCSFYISSTGDLCTEGRIQLRANATSGTPATYLWSNGLTTNRISIHWGGTYSVTVTFSNGCTQTQSIYVEDPVGPGCIYYLKAEPLQFLQTSEFPNPVNTELTVEIANDLLETNSHDIPVILLDPSGKTTFASSFKKDNNQIKIDTQNMPAGLYLLQIGSGKTGVVRKKVMVVH